MWEYSLYPGQDVAGMSTGGKILPERKPTRKKRAMSKLFAHVMFSLYRLDLFRDEDNGWPHDVHPYYACMTTRIVLWLLLANGNCLSDIPALWTAVA